MRANMSGLLDEIVGYGGLVALVLLVNAGCSAETNEPDPQ